MEAALRGALHTWGPDIIEELRRQAWQQPLPAAQDYLLEQALLMRELWFCGAVLEQPLTEPVQACWQQLQQLCLLLSWQGDWMIQAADALQSGLLSLQPISDQDNLPAA